jgi:ribonuclease P protein component
LKIKKNGLSKIERLKSKVAFDILFEQGNSFTASPFRVIYLIQDNLNKDNFPIKVGFSVSRKSFRKATERNLIKRRMRAAWRLNKQELKYYSHQIDYHTWVLLIFTQKQQNSYLEIEKGVKDTIYKLNRKIDEFAKSKSLG